MTGKDKDYRYMATSYLLNNEGFRADADLEIKVSNIVLQQLDDAAGDVSGLAVKWFGFCASFHSYLTSDNVILLPHYMVLALIKFCC